MRVSLVAFGAVRAIAQEFDPVFMLRVGGMQLFRAESSDKSEKIRPRMSQVSSVLISVYFLLTGACGVALAVAGMPLFDAVCHAISAVSTGGFSTKAISVGAFPSPAILWILTIAMFAGGMTFVLLAQAMHAALPAHERPVLLAAEEAGFKNPDQPPVFLTLETAHRVLVAMGSVAILLVITYATPYRLMPFEGIREALENGIQAGYPALDADHIPEHLERITQQAHAGSEDQATDQDRQQRFNRRPAGEHDDEAGG